MVFRQWQDVLKHSGDARSASWLARWAGLDEGALNDWELEPEYGAFVGQDGRVVSGAQQRGAWLDAEDPRQLRWSSAVAELRRQHPSSVAVFLDWGRQALSWPELFDRWDDWEATGQVLACGPVDVPWSLSQTWRAPAYVVFRGELDHGLSVVPLASDTTGEPRPMSLLARAQALRDAAQGTPSWAPIDEGDALPMLPFTLSSLSDANHRWPTGTEAFGA